MRLDQQPAYVLHARPYRETSLLLECLTRDFGRIGAVARGVRRERAQLARSQLEPFQQLRVDLLQRGELATLLAAETAAPPRRLLGEAGVSGLYLNELVVRLTARQDPHPPLFDTYARTLERLAAGEPLAWTLRRFERDLLETIGYALGLDCEADGERPLVPEQHYRYLPEQGAVPVPAHAKGALRGADLLALGADAMPDLDGLRALRGMMRELIRFHLGGNDLKAWQVLGSAVRTR